MTVLDTTTFQNQMAQVESLVRRVETLEDASARESALALVRALMELHAAGVERMMEIAYEAGEPVRRIVDDFAADELVSSLLLLHDLHPVDVETRVRQALDGVRPFLLSHGGDVELVGIVDGAVTVRLVGSCNGCASSSATLRGAVEEAIFAAAPDVAEVLPESAASASSTLVQIGIRRSAGAGASEGGVTDG